METKGIVITPDDVDNIIRDYGAQRAATAQIVVELSGINNIDVLLLLRIMGKKEQTVDDIAQAAEVLLDGQTIKFVYGSTVLKTVAYNRGNGNALHMMFADEAYLYDVLQQTVYALLLKKLTPHLEGSN